MTMKVNHKQAKEHIEICVKAKRALIVHGPPGIGKSQVIWQVAKDLAGKDVEVVRHGNPAENEFGFVDLRASMLEPSDILGVPFADEGRTKYMPPDILPKKGRGIFFFDELNLAPPSIQAAAYQLILDRRVGTYELPDGWSVVAAGNRDNDGAFVFQMAKPLQNRFAQHIELMAPSIDDWTTWASKNGVREEIVSFLMWQEGSLFSFDPKSTEMAYATPRTWEMLSDLMKAAAPADEETGEPGSIDYTVARDLAMGCVGEGIGVKFGAFIKHKRELNLKKVWDDPASIHDFKGKGEKSDLIFAAVSTIAEVGARETKPKKGEKNSKFAAALMVANSLADEKKGQDKELGIYLSKLLKTHAGDKKFMDALINAEWNGKVVVDSWSANYQDLIRAK